MGRILAIDYGTKRVGLAVTDPLKLIASGLTTLHSKDVIPYLKDYFNKENVDCIVIGYPLSLNNEPTHATAHVENFENRLRKIFPEKRIVRIDERFTSKIALQTMIDSGMKKKARRNKALIDEISATIILQDYLEQIKH